MLDPRVEAVLDVISTRVPDDVRARLAAQSAADVARGWYASRDQERIAIFEWGHETTPTDAELVELAEKIVAAIDAASL